jgi:hypothetical protein
MTYTVTNDGDKEQRFYPQIDLLTTDGNVHAADENIPKRVFDEIKLRERNGFLEEFTSINGPIRLGPAEARDGVAIWPETTPRMEHFSIFVTGLSGEAVAMKMVDGKPTKIDVAVTMKDGKLVPLDNDNSAADLYDKNDPEGHIRKDLIILRKTLQLNFFIRGDEVYPGEDEVNKGSETCITRLAWSPDWTGHPIGLATRKAWPLQCPGFSRRDENTYNPASCATIASYTSPGVFAARSACLNLSIVISRLIRASAWICGPVLSGGLVSIQITLTGRPSID